MSANTLTDLDEFVIWSKQHGHYGYLKAMLENFYKCKESRKEHENAALQNLARQDD